jgi:hypothetical protein
MIIFVIMTNRERYIDVVVDMIKKNDVTFNKLVPKGINRFVTKDYYVTEIMDTRFTDPMAFFSGPNWLVMGQRIKNKYGISDYWDVERIREQLEEYFIQNH